MDFLLKRSQMPAGVETPRCRSQASKWEADGKLRVWASDDAEIGFEAAFDCALDLGCDDLVVLGNGLGLAGRLADETLDMAGRDAASAAALAALDLVTLPANIAV